MQRKPTPHTEFTTLPAQAVSLQAWPQISLAVGRLCARGTHASAAWPRDASSYRRLL